MKTEKPSNALQRAIAKAKRQRWEDLFLSQLRAVAQADNIGIGGWAREWYFDRTRKWRFDFAWPVRICVAVEIEGLMPPGSKSRHTTNSGFSKDCEKYN